MTMWMMTIRSERSMSLASEMALHVLAYNMKRVIQILGVGGLIAAMRA
jgi:hypothetical protein